MILASVAMALLLALFAWCFYVVICEIICHDEDEGEGFLAAYLHMGAAALALVGYLAIGSVTFP